MNNQGLECLRFLNEVISDFDQVSSERWARNGQMKARIKLYITVRVSEGDVLKSELLLTDPSLPTVTRSGSVS